MNGNRRVTDEKKKPYLDLLSKKQSIIAGLMVRNWLEAVLDRMLDSKKYGLRQYSKTSK